MISMANFVSVRAVSGTAASPAFLNLAAMFTLTAARAQASLWPEETGGTALVHQFHETDLLSGIHCFFPGL